MTFSIRTKAINLATLLREVGYRPLGYTPNSELNAVRPLGGDYPRFHLYAKQEGDEFIFNLHLDQKKPSYAGAPAHGGDYDSETVSAEAQRIQSVIDTLHT